jgi:hypothetical protein
MLTGLLSSVSFNNSYAQVVSVKLESQPVCLDSLNSIWQEFGSPFPCFVNGTEIELSKPILDLKSYRAIYISRLMVKILLSLHPS